MNKKTIRYRYIEEKVRGNRGSETGVNKLETKKIDIRKDSTSGRMKSLKALIRIDNQIINMTVDTGSPISFLNWTVAKQILDSSGKMKAKIQSAGWEVPDASFLIT